MEETPKVEVAVKRGRGRPKGSKNKPKVVVEPTVEVQVEPITE
jgi:hypothetical protein